MKSCMNCHHAIISGGDRVPYGSTTATLPEYVKECNSSDAMSWSEEEYEENLEKFGSDASECPFYKEIKPKVKLVGEDGNAFNIMGKVIKALKMAGQDDKIEEYKEKAMSGDYNNLLAVTMDFVDVE